MKVWRKFTAVALVFVMALAMSATALATPEDMNQTGGVIGAFDPDATENDAVTSPEIKDTSVTIYKELKVFNPSATTVSAPTISYSYAIAAGSADVTIIDEKGVIVTTKQGVFTDDNSKPSITPSVAWSASNTVTAAPYAASGNSGSGNRKPITINFDGVTFPSAGVYRYVITESVASGAYAAAGVEDGTSSATRYLDVYVKDETVSGSVVEKIYGYVLIDGNIEIAASDTTDLTHKTEGFVGAGADEYHTFNLTITKNVVNDNYNAVTVPHKFPFTIQFTSSVTANVLPTVTTSNSSLATVPTLSAAAFSGINTVLTTTTTMPKIASGGSITFTGIPMGTSVTISETNDVIGTTYAVTSSGADIDIAAANAVPLTNGQSTTANLISISEQTANSEADKSVTVTNSLLTISPTGVTLRYAPYLAMLGAGVVAMPLSIRRKREDF